MSHTPNEQPFDIQSLHTAYRNGLKAESMMDECYRRIEKSNDPGIFIQVFNKATIRKNLATLGEFDPVSKPLWGLPFALKDNIDCRDEVTTAACPAYSYSADQDAFVVALLRKAGAVPVGKTNLDQFATGLVGVRSPYPIPKNAIDPDLVPGGSSSGSAVAVARGLVSFALGTDTAGSGRVPAAFNNIVGLKPTLGAISSTGVVPACKTLDTVSVFALTVEDAFQVLKTTAKVDPSDSFSRPVEIGDLSVGLPNFKFGIPNAGSLKVYEDSIQEESFKATINQLKEIGGTPVEVDLSPFFEAALLLYDGAWLAERYAVVKDLLARDPNSLLPITRAIIEPAGKLKATDLFKDIYRLKALKKKTRAILESVDMLCVPTIPRFYSLGDLSDDPIGPNTRLGTYTNFANLLDLCAIAVPVSSRSDGLPGSITLLAMAGQDQRISSVAAKLQQFCNTALGATEWRLPKPSTSKGKAHFDEIALAAVGAHMSGLPLNHEITGLGGRFLYETCTSSNYRLYKLPGGPPFKPGLVRDETGESIAIEIWAMPLDRFGEFIRKIPPPLGIGTLSLQTGDEVKGFICEPIGIKDAEDITHYKGWRHFLDSD